MLIDFIYRADSIQEQLDNISGIGMKVFEYTNAAPAACAVRERRDLIARMIDEVSSTVDSPHILSLACGHLNEAKHTEAVRENRIGRFVAFDQDPVSLKIVEETFDRKGYIECVHGSVVELIKNKVHLGEFDLIYALGLFDYLSQPIAKRLTKNMFGMLRSGGRMIIGNFVPNIKDVGYMESFMDWKLINRSNDEMERLVADLKDQNSEKRIFYEKNRNIVFLEICKN